MSAKVAVPPAAAADDLRTRSEWETGMKDPTPTLLFGDGGSDLGAEPVAGEAANVDMGCVDIPVLHNRRRAY